MRKVRLLSFVLMAGTASLLLLILFFYWPHRPVSGRPSKIFLQGLSGSAQVLRDRWGIPHIKADNKKDLFRVLGHEMARDRLFQMELNRRVGNGELSEIFGEKLLPADRLFRTLRFRKSMELLFYRHKDSISPELLELTQSFLDGINEYVRTHDGLQKSPVEFSLLRIRPRKFEIADILAFSGYMAYSFNDAVIKDPLWGKIKGKLPRNGDAGIVLPAFDGSNSWVLSPKRSSTGKALLANDPHIGFSQPGVWYEAHLECPGFSIYGHFLPLVPFPVLGHNERFAWAITMSEIDDTDFYKEKLSSDGSQVMYEGQWRDLKSYQEKIKVKGRKEPEILNVQLTPHGPLMDGISDEWSGRNLSMKWAFHHPKNFLLESMFGILMSKDLETFGSALSLLKAPGLNFSYADREGHIAWWVAGAVPLRPPHLKGDTIMDGSSGRDEYEYADFSSNPRLIDPAEGIIVSANYIPPTILGKKGPMIPGYYRPSERYLFLSQYLRSKEKWGVEELKVLQTSEQAISTGEVLTHLLELVKRVNPQDFSTLENQALKILEAWKGESNSTSVASTLYHQWNQENFKLLFRKEWTPEEFKNFALLADWWPQYKLKLQEASEGVIKKGLLNAVTSLSQKLGPDISTWAWGKIHTLELIHPLGRVPPLNRLFNIGPFAVGGGENQVNNMKPKSAAEDFQVVAGPSTRRIIDFSNPKRAWGILPTGESGNIFSPHYRDQTKLFLSGQYREELMDWNIIKEEKKGEIIFSPVEH